MNFILNLVVTSFEKVVLSLLHNWPYLLVGIVISAVLKLYIDGDKIAAFLRRFRGLGVVAATTVAVTTPLCSCGTTAVVLGMMASTMPWAPIVAFMVSSPLTSPEGLVYSAGLFGWPFALAFFLASILLGLAGGAVAALFESRGWLADQARFAAPVPGKEAIPIHLETASGCGEYAPQSKLADTPEPACGCAQPAPFYASEAALFCIDRLQPVTACACGTEAAAVVYIAPKPAVGPAYKEITLSKISVNLIGLLKEIYNSSKQLLPMFLGFAFIGNFLNSLIPASWVAAAFGSGNAYSVPLAATLGLPLYINTEGSLPLIWALLDAGMSQGAALAFMIAGAGTSIGAITGALTIARWRVVALVIGVLWVGAILSGYAYDLLLVLNLF